MPGHDETPFEELQELSRRAAALFHVARAASASVSTHDVAALTLTQARDALSADAGAVYELVNDDLRLIVACEGQPAPPELVSLSSALPIARAVKGREAVFLFANEDTDVLREELVPDLEKLPPRAHAAIPLLVGDQVIGALALTFADPDRLTRAARDFLTAVAAICAGAAERTRLYEAERAANEQAVDLQRLAAALSGVLAPRDVALAAVEIGLEILGAQAGGVALAVFPEGILEVLEGVGNAMATPGATLPIVREAAYSWPLFSGEAVFIEDSEGFERQFPPGLSGSWFQGGSRIVLPMEIDGRPGAILAFGYNSWRSFSPGDRGLARAVADLCASALDRARLYELERNGRVEAERNQWRFRILSTASKLLAQTHDWEGTLTEAAQLALDGFADWCIADVVTSPLNVRRIACVHKDPARRAAAEALEALGIGPPESSPARQAIDSGVHVFWPNVPVFMSNSEDEVRNRLFRELGLGSVISSPLAVRGEILGALTFVRSIPEHPFEDSDVAVADELARRVALAVEAARLYHATDEARTRAERALQARDAVLGIVSHDLLNPLTIVQMAATALAKVHGDGDERVKRHATKILQSVSRMKRLIDDLLDLGALESGALSMSLGISDVAALVADTVSQMRPLASARQQALRLHPAPTALLCRADGDRLGQVLSNLIGNAIKYTQEGGRIDVTVRDRLGRAEVEVTDDGPGIAADQLPHVFERFWRAASSHSRPRGVGLGLSIARSIIRAHGGEISATSTPGVGSTFTFAIPLVQQPLLQPITTAGAPDAR